MNLFFVVSMERYWCCWITLKQFFQVILPWEFNSFRTVLFTWINIQNFKSDIKKIIKYFIFSDENKMGKKNRILLCLRNIGPSFQCFKLCMWVLNVRIFKLQLNWNREKDNHQSFSLIYIQFGWATIICITFSPKVENSIKRMFFLGIRLGVT